MFRSEPRRAAVALILRVVPPTNFPLPPAPSGDSKLSLPEFFAQDWVSHPNARPEILFLHRENAASAPAADPNVTNDAAVAFPGGRMEADDEDGLFTAMRHTWEEIGIDLAETDYMSIGQLDDREITTSLGKRTYIPYILPYSNNSFVSIGLLMILSPFVFLQLSPYTRPVDPVQETSLHWVPLTALFPAPALVIAQPTPPRAEDEHDDKRLAHGGVERGQRRAGPVDPAIVDTAVSHRRLPSTNNFAVSFAENPIGEAAVSLACYAVR